MSAAPPPVDPNPPAVDSSVAGPSASVSAASTAVQPERTVQKLPAQWQRSLGVSLLGIVLGFALAALIILLKGKPLGQSLSALIDGSLTSGFALGNTLNKAAALLFVACGFIVAIKGGLVNIGGEGQILIGGVGAVAAALATKGLPGPLPLLIALIAGFTVGGLWGSIAGWLKARLGVNEVIVTLLLNYLAANLIDYALDAKALLRDGDAEPQSAEVPGVARLGRLLPNSTSRLHMGVLLAALVAGVVWFVLRKTVPGMKVRMLGHNPQMAARAGVSLKRMPVVVMFISGGLAGLAGCSMLLGEQYRARPSFSPGYGFDGVAVALIARNNPLAAIPAAILFGALRAGGNLLEAKTQVSQALVLVIQGTIILAVVGTAYLLKKNTVAEVAE
jgi:general nucleoside transport system permease protein